MDIKRNDDISLKPSTTSLLPTNTTSASISGGLIISTTDAIRSFLTVASTDYQLSEDLRDLSSSLLMHSSVPYKSLKSIWLESKPEIRPNLSAILSGCEFIFISPKPRERSEELKARLLKLSEAAERKMYKDLVKDITPKKREAEPFSSFKDHDMNIICQYALHVRKDGKLSTNTATLLLNIQGMLESWFPSWF